MFLEQSENPETVGNSQINILYLLLYSDLRSACESTQSRLDHILVVCDWTRDEKRTSLLVYPRTFGMYARRKGRTNLGNSAKAITRLYIDILQAS
jgi:hypothetical protein